MSTHFQGTKIMTRTTQFLSRMLVVLFAATLGLNAASAQSADPYKFEKKAYKPDGTPWSGPVNVGDTVKYVLSYKPGATNSGPVTIDDTLSPNQTYVAPTQGPGWTWGVSPYAAGNHEQYVNPGFGPGNSVKLTIPGVPSPSPGAGDGTSPIPILSLNKVFGVFHHAGNPAEGKVDCWDLASLAKCPSYPKPNSLSGFIRTPNTPQAVVRGTNLYFLGHNAANVATIGCFDGLLDTACADTPLPISASSIGEIAGLVEDGTGQVFAAVKDKLLCRKLSGRTWLDCAGWPTAGITSISPAPPASSMYISAEFGPSPSKIYIHQGAGMVQCIDIGTKLPCAGWVIAGKSAGSSGNVLSSIPNGTGNTDGGVCLWASSTLKGCVKSNGTSVVGSPASAGLSSFSSYRLPGTSKVYFPNFGGATGPTCLDFTNANGVACAGFTPQAPAGAMQYGFSVDPTKPEKCMLSLGHNNFMWRFDYNSGNIGCGSTTVSTPPIDQLYCNGAPDPTKFQWSSVNVTTPSAAGVLTIKQGGTTATITLISGTTNYAMPATIALGSGPLTFSYAPTSGPSSLDLVVGYTSNKNPEICYQAKVNKCGPVFNDAVFKGGLNGTPISVAQKVDLGVAKGPECDIPPPPVVTCLKGDAKVTCGEKPGTYVITLAASGAGGVTPTSVSITPTTAGVTIVNPQSSYPVIGGLVKIVVAGANPGDVLTFDMEGTTAGAGSAAGTDLCCNGTIKVTIPQDIKCKQPDISILKTGPKTCVPGQPCTFTITITNNGVPYNGNVLLWDQVSPNAWPVTAITPNVCGTSITTTPFSCVANLNLAANQSMSFTVTMTSSFNGTLVNENCIGVALAPSWLSPNTSYSKAELKKLFDKYGPLKKQSESCWKVHQPEDKVDLAIKKTGATTPAPGSPFYSFKMDVTNEGAAYTAAAGVLTVTDVVPAGMTFNSVTGTAGWSCAPNTNVPQGTLITCTYAGGALAAGPAAPVGTINISATANGAPPFPPFENCADVALLPTSGTTDAVAANNKSCVTVTKPPSSTIDIVKTCKPAVYGKFPVGPAATGLGFHADCTLTVTTTGPQTSPITAGDTLAGTGTIVNMTAPAPWVCTAPNCTVNGTALNQSSSTTVISAIAVFANAGDAMEAKNCGKVEVAGKLADESCVPIVVEKGKLTVVKEASFNGTHITNVNFPIAVTCGGATTNATFADSAPYVQSNIPVGTSCSVVEGAAPQTGLCKKNQTEVWTTSYNPTTPVTATVSGATINVRNILSCKEDVDSKLYIKKVVVNNAPLPLEPLVFTIRNTCSNDTSVSGIDNLTDGQTKPYHLYIPNTTCTVQEDPIPATAACGDLKPVWTTSYSPSQTVTLSPNGETVTVTNTLNCERIDTPIDNRMYIKKVVVNNAPGSLEGIEYDITSQCTNTTQPTGFAHFSDGETVLFHNYEAGMSCNLSEVIPATTACGKGMTDVWSTTYSPSQTVNLSPNGETITVTNTLNCEPIADPKLSTFSVSKEASYNGEPILGTPFQMNVTCDDGTVQSLAVLSGQSQTINGLPVGTTCNVVEGKIGTTNLCPKGSVEKWTTTYNPANGSNTTAANSSVVVRVDNLLTCEPIIIDNPLVCDPATATNAGDLCRCRFNNMQQVSKTSCECKDGFNLKEGKGCVPIVVTPKCDPATTVTKGDACVCEYRNMVQVSKTACACAKGFKFAAGKGCFKPEPVCKKSERFQPARNRCEPVCGKGFEYSVKRNTCNPVRIDCGKGTVYNAKRNRCDKAQPVCRPPFVYDAKRKACVEVIKRECERGQIKVGKRCVTVPNCPFGQIPIPGTGICVSIGGGGGGGPKDDGPKCVPQPGRECL